MPLLRYIPGSLPDIRAGFWRSKIHVMARLGRGLEAAFDGVTGPRVVSGALWARQRYAFDGVMGP